MKLLVGWASAPKQPPQAIRSFGGCDLAALDGRLIPAENSSRGDCYSRSSLRALKAAIALAFLGLILNTLASVTADPDLWGYMAFGRLFWDTGQFPYQDVFSYLPTLSAWIYHEWLTGVLVYPIFQTMGGSGVQLLKYGAGLATISLIYSVARKRGASPLSSIFVLCAVQLFLAIGFRPIRAQVFTYVFFALSLYILESARLKGQWRGLWLLPPLQILWCNLHGGFLAGLGLLGLYSAGEFLARRRFRPYLMILFLAGLATIINPYGLQYWQYMIQGVTMARPEITEWASIWRAYQQNLLGAEEFLYLFAIIGFMLLLVSGIGREEMKKEWPPILVLGVTLLLGLKHLRHMVFFLIAVGAYAPVWIARYSERWHFRSLVAPFAPILRGKICTLACFGVAILGFYQFLAADPLALKIPSQATSTERPGQYYPVGALDYIQSHHLEGDLLTEFGWGEYLIWNLSPHCRISLDGRYETVYPVAIANYYFDFFKNPSEQRRFLDDYPPAMLLVNSRSKIYAFLCSQGQWQQVYLDQGSALFLKKDRVTEAGKGISPVCASWQLD
jgi:hypothetical protein